MSQQTGRLSAAGCRDAVSPVAPVATVAVVAVVAVAVAVVMAMAAVPGASAAASVHGEHGSAVARSSRRGHHAGTARRRGRGHRGGHTAHVLRASDRARLHYVSAKGATLYEVGRATGTLPGGMQVHLRVEARFTGSFVIHARGGSIRGHGQAAARGHGTIESFHGTLVVTGGSGRFRHAHGRAGLYGTFNRANYALTIKTTGTLHY